MATVYFLIFFLKKDLLLTWWMYRWWGLSFRDGAAPCRGASDCSLSTSRPVLCARKPRQHEALCESHPEHHREERWAGVSWYSPGCISQRFNPMNHDFCLTPLKIYPNRQFHGIWCSVTRQTGGELIWLLMEWVTRTGASTNFLPPLFAPVQNTTLRIFWTTAADRGLALSSMERITTSHAESASRDNTRNYLMN